MKSHFKSVGCYEKREIDQCKGSFSIKIEGIRNTGTYKEYSCTWTTRKSRKLGKEVKAGRIKPIV